jgi:hypothetical protein
MWFVRRADQGNRPIDHASVNPLGIKAFSPAVRLARVFSWSISAGSVAGGYFLGLKSLARETHERAWKNSTLSKESFNAEYAKSAEEAE